MIVVTDLAHIPLSGSDASTAAGTISRAGRRIPVGPSTTGEEILEGDHDDAGEEEVDEHSGTRRFVRPSRVAVL